MQSHERPTSPPLRRSTLRLLHQILCLHLQLPVVVRCHSTALNPSLFPPQRRMPFPAARAPLQASTLLQIVLHEYLITPWRILSNVQITHPGCRTLHPEFLHIPHDLTLILLILPPVLRESPQVSRQLRAALPMSLTSPVALHNTLHVSTLSNPRLPHLHIHLRPPLHPLRLPPLL